MENSEHENQKDAFLYYQHNTAMDKEVIFRITPYSPTLKSFQRRIVWPETHEQRLKVAQEIVDDINSQDLSFRAILVTSE